MWLGASGSIISSTYCLLASAAENVMCGAVASAWDKRAARRVIFQLSASVLVSWARALIAHRSLRQRIALRCAATDVTQRCSEPHPELEWLCAREEVVLTLCQHHVGAQLCPQLMLLCEGPKVEMRDICRQTGVCEGRIRLLEKQKPVSVITCLVRRTGWVVFGEHGALAHGGATYRAAANVAGQQGAARYVDYQPVPDRRNSRAHAAFCIWVDHHEHVALAGVCIGVCDLRAIPQSRIPPG